MQVYFADTMKFFLSLYGHKLPVLCMDVSSDSTMLLTGSSDKNIKASALCVSTTARFPECAVRSSCSLPPCQAERQCGLSGVRESVHTSLRPARPCNALLPRYIRL